MKKVDIIFDSPLNAIIGPVQTVKRILNNRDFFIKNGYDISAFTQDLIYEDSLTLKIKHNPSKFVGGLKKIAKFLAKKSFLYSYFRYRAAFRSSRNLMKYYMSLERQPDIVVFHGIDDCYQFMKYNKNNNIKTCLFTHSDGLMFKQFLDGFPKLKGTFVERKLMNMANYVFDNLTVNPCIAKIEEKNHHLLFPQTIGKTILVVNAIDDLTTEQKNEIKNISTQNFSPKYRLICVGGFTGRKGQKLIIEALHQVKAEVLEDISVELVGDGIMKTPYEELVKSYGLEEHISFTGAIPNSEVYKNLAKANIFVLMSANEGLPIALLEAIRSGLAIIATNVSGIPEVAINGQNGVLIDHKVSDLVEILNNIEKYDWENMGQKSRKLFEEYYQFPRMRSDYLKMLNFASSEKNVREMDN